MLNWLKNISKYKYTIQVVIAGSFAFTSIGTFVGWTTPSLQQLASADSPIDMTSDQISWLASMLGIGGPMAAIVCAFTLNKLGRKPVILGAAMAYIIGWIIMIFSTEPLHLCIGRYFHGLGAGSTFCALPLYMGEMVNKNIRGIILTILLICSSLATLISFVIGSLVSFRTLNIFSLISPVLMFITFMFAPESPFFLMRIGKKKEATECLMKLNGCQQVEQVEEDVRSIEKFIEDDTKSANFLQSLRVLKEPKSKKALIIITVLLLGQQFSGVLSIVMYMGMIFESVELPLSTMYATVISEVLSLISILISSVTMDRFGRKPLFVVSSSICILSHLVVGSFFHLKANNIIGNEYSLVVLIGIFIMRMGYELGLGCVPNVVVSEILSFNIKGIASGYYAFVQGVTLSISAKLYQIISDNLGQHYAHWLFSICVLLSMIFIAYYMPETKNKTFMEIQEDLDNDDISVEGINNEKKANSGNDVYRAKEVI